MRNQKKKEEKQGKGLKKQQNKKRQDKTRQEMIRNEKK